VRFKASLKSAEGHQLIANLASAFGIDEQNADTAVEALDRELRARIERNMLSRGGVADVLSLVTQPTAASALTETGNLASPSLTETGNLASPSLTESGDHILDVLIGNKHISRGIAARAASEARLDPGTVEKLLPVVASLMISQLQRKSQPALEKLVQNVPGLVSAGGSPLPMPGDNIPGIGRESQRSPMQQNPYDRLPDIVRRGGGPQVPGGGSLEGIIRSIFGNLLGRNRGVIGTMIQLFLIRWLASIARRILSRVLTNR
jgi:hypothetical protein